MNSTDWIGSIGVLILLVAYLLNITGNIIRNGLTYLLMNILGSGLACLASVLLNYLPFIILEACWAVFSILALLTLYRKK